MRTKSTDQAICQSESKKQKGTVSICNKRYKIYEVSEIKDDKPGAHKESDTRYTGDSDPDHSTILILSGQSQDAFLDTVWHEILHSVFSDSGARELMSRHKMGEREEELLIQILAPHFVQIAKTLNLKKSA